MTGTVIVRFDEDGELTYLASGDVRLFVVDERAPHDRVYEVKRRVEDHQIADVLRDTPVGHSDDARHAAISAKVIALVEGRKPLSVVPK